MTDIAEIPVVELERLQLRKPMAPEQFRAAGKGDFYAQEAAQCGHPRAQLPGAGDSGCGGLCRDSLGLSQQAAATKADVIVFCGVHFMAETAKILNPDKIVVLPDKDAGCSLEQSCPAESWRHFKRRIRIFGRSPTSIAAQAVKALADVICTSGNAVKIVNAAPKDKDLLFVPDENLGAWVMEQTGRPMTLWRGIVTRTSNSGATALENARGIIRTPRLSSTPKVCRSARFGGCDLFDGKDDHLLQIEPGQAIRGGDRVRNHPSDAKGMSGQRIHLRADL